MHYEVETKLKVKNPAEMRKKIRSFAKFLKKVHKEDVYFRDRSDTHGYPKGYPKKRFRIRKEHGVYTFNYKEGRWPRLIYAKKEHEFRIKNVKSFLKTLKDKGFIVFCRKVKDCEIYRYDSANIELNKVKHLGWYVEIESLCEKSSQIKQARNKVRKIMRLLGAKKSDVETRGYTVIMFQRGMCR